MKSKSTYFICSFQHQLTLGGDILAKNSFEAYTENDCM